jgi:hypothetical protein
MSKCMIVHTLIQKRHGSIRRRATNADHHYLSILSQLDELALTPPINAIQTLYTPSRMAECHPFVKNVFIYYPNRISVNYNGYG